MEIKEAKTKFNRVEKRRIVECSIFILRKHCMKDHEDARVEKIQLIRGIIACLFYGMPQFFTLRYCKEISNQLTLALSNVGFCF